jgi:proteasome lid subunit RPN8/RPN11
MNALLRISPSAVTATIDEIAKVSDGQREAAAFWLGPTGTLATRTIVIPAGRGVVLQPLSLRISEEWMNLLGQLCDLTGQIILGGVHSHPEGAFYSGIDRDGFFHAPDFVSVVLPNYGKTDLAAAETDWGVYVGLPWGEWKASRWGSAVALEDELWFKLETLRLPK